MVLVQAQPSDKQRSCLAKRRYWSQVDALVMAARQREREGVPELGTYPCSNCGGWHLTRQVGVRNPGEKGANGQTQYLA